MTLENGRPIAMGKSRTWAAGAPCAGFQPEGAQAGFLMPHPVGRGPWQVLPGNWNISPFLFLSLFFSPKIKKIPLTLQGQSNDNERVNSTPWNSGVCTQKNMVTRDCRATWSDNVLERLFF